MFNYGAFTPTQSSPQKHHTPTHNVHQVSSPTNYFPNSSQPNSTWSSPSQPFFLPPDSQVKEPVPFNVRALLGNEDETSSTSSDSEETDTMPDVSPKFKTNFVREWDFGQHNANRRKSEILSSNNSLLQNLIGSPEHTSNKTWSPFVPNKTTVKPTFFGPLNKATFAQNEKRAFFVTLEGFNLSTSQRFFKIERLCHCMQSKKPSDSSDFGQFLYLSFWNDWNNGQDDSENIFEPWVHAIPSLNFRLTVKIHMSHSQEDAYNFDFQVDLRSFAIPTKEKITQSCEIVYTEPSNSNSPGLTSGNNITIHAQVSNEKLLVPHGFKNTQDVRQNSSNSYSVILRQIFIGLPLYRSGATISPISPLLQQIQRPNHNVYGKRGSAIVLGRNPRPADQDPKSPLSWSNFSPEMSPAHNFTPPKQTSNGEPALPPGIMSQGNYQDMQGGNPSLFKVQNAARFSFKNNRRESAEGLVMNRNGDVMQQNDFARFLEQQDRRPQHLRQDYMNGSQDFHRRASLNIDSTGALNSLTRFQMQNMSAIRLDSETYTQSNISSTVNISSYTDTMVDVVPFEDDIKPAEPATEFKLDEYIGKMAELVKTYQGSKVLQNYVIASKKEDLDLVFQEIGEKIGDLMLDPYANYMIQTLVQNGLPRQRLYLLQKLAPSFTSIARDKKGTHSLQAIVAQIDTQDEFNLMKNILGASVLELSMDPRANYVIQKLINIIPVEASYFLYQPLFDNFVQVANNSFGLLVLKQMMVRVEQSDPLKQKVIDLTSVNFEKLVQNPYGNYAIQHIIEFYPKDSHLIMNKILAKIIPYASQKISSNIIEKCLAVCDAQFKRKVVEEILKNGRLGDLMKNKYGNFVTLQLLATASTLDKQKLMQEILRCANSFNGTKYKTRWLKFVEDNPLKVNWVSTHNYNEDQDNGFEEEDAAAIAKDLEAVKRIWREMTKEEKGDSPAHPHHSHHNSNASNKGGYGKKSYSKDNTYGSWSSKN